MQYNEITDSSIDEMSITSLFYNFSVDQIQNRIMKFLEEE